MIGGRRLQVWVAGGVELFELTLAPSRAALTVVPSAALGPRPPE